MSQAVGESRAVWRHMILLDALSQREHFIAQAYESDLKFSAPIYWCKVGALQRRRQRLTLGCGRWRCDASRAHARAASCWWTCL